MCVYWPTSRLKLFGSMLCLLPVKRLAGGQAHTPMIPKSAEMQGLEHCDSKKSMKTVPSSIFPKSSGPDLRLKILKFIDSYGISRYIQTLRVQDPCRAFSFSDLGDASWNVGAKRVGLGARSGWKMKIVKWRVKYGKIVVELMVGKTGVSLPGLNDRLPMSSWPQT